MLSGTVYVEHGDVESLRAKNRSVSTRTFVSAIEEYEEAEMKKRLDLLMVERALAPSREKAKAYIMSGEVYVDGQKEDKAGTMFQETVKIEVRGNTLPYVSRGGLKLEKAMKNFDVSLDRQGLYGCRSIHRWIYRLYASERSCQSIFHRCRIWSAGLGTS